MYNVCILTMDNHINTLYTGAINEGPSSVIYLPGVTPLPIELTCRATGSVIAWIVNDTNYDVVQLINRALPGHELANTNILVNSPVNNTEYICVFENDDGNETYSDPAYVVIAGKYIKYKL